MSGQHFRDYHLLLDEQATQIFAMTDDIAERARKIGGTTIHSISDIAKNQRLKDNNKEGVSPQEMIGELCDDNQQLTRTLRATHEICDHHNDVATDESDRGLDRRNRAADVVLGGDSASVLTNHGALRNRLVKRPGFENIGN